MTSPLAGRHVDLGSTRHVDVGLAVRYDDHLLSTQLAVQDVAQRGGHPRQLLLVARAVVGLEFLDQRAQILGDRPELGRRSAEALRPSPSGRQDHPLAAQQGAHALHPPAPRELRDDDRDEGDGETEADEEEEEILARFLAAPRDEAHVVHEHELSQRLQAPDRYEHRPLGRLEQVGLGRLQRIDGRAVHFLGEGRRRDRIAAVVRAVGDGEQSLVLRQSCEELQDPAPVARRNQLLQRLLHRIRDETGADVEVAAEPAEHQPVNQRDGRVGKDAEGQKEGDDEAK